MSHGGDRASGGLRRIFFRVGPATLFVQLVSFASSVALATLLGPSTRTDAYYLALSVPALAYAVLIAAVRLGGIPVLTKIAHSGSPAEFTRTSRELMTATGAAAAVMSIVLTTVMIVLIAVLNDAAILSIAYDRAEPSPTPVRWEMRTVLTIALVLGGVGVGFSFLLLALALRVWALPLATAQTMLYLKLSVAGHLGIFATRTKGPFWSSRPARLLLAAVLGTQALATGIAVSGWLFAPLPLVWVGVVWGFSVLDLLAFDLAKRAAYRWLEPTAAARTAGGPPPASRGARVRTVFYRRRFGAPSRVSD